MFRKTAVVLTLDNYKHYLVCDIQAYLTGSTTFPVVYSLNVSYGLYSAIYEDVVITYKYNDTPEEGSAEYTATLPLTIGGFGVTPKHLVQPKIINITGRIKY
jgi:hypothetical protein